MSQGPAPSQKTYKFSVLNYCVTCSVFTVSVSVPSRIRLLPPSEKGNERESLAYDPRSSNIKM